MYINGADQITNTPTNIVAAYNTWPYQVPENDRYQHVPVCYIDHNGQVHEWDQWNPPVTKNIPGGRYKATPTRTGSYYLQNTIIAPQ